MAKKEDNLHLFTSEQSREEAVGNGKKGGIASGKARRKKKEISKAVTDFLDGKDIGENITRLDKMIIKLYSRAIDDDDKQNTASMRLLFELSDSFRKPDEKRRLKLANKLTKAETELIQKKIDSMF